MQPNGLTDSMTCQKLAVEIGYWTLFRYNPALRGTGQDHFSLDSRPPKKDPILFLKTHTRYAPAVTLCLFCSIACNSGRR